MSSNPFKIDFRKWALMLLPTLLRRPVLYHLLYVMLTPIVSIYRSFFARRMNNIFYARYDSSYGNIKRMLNILFPSETGAIEVKPATTTDVVYKKIYITTSITDDSAIVGESYIDKADPQKLFNVDVPADLQDKKAQIDNIVSRYALPGYGFNVN